MKTIFKNIYHWISTLSETIISLCTILLFSSFKTARNISKYKKDDLSDVYILANGPSLKIMIDEHLDFLKSHETLVMNFFANNQMFEIVKPKYYILLDPGFFGGYVSSEISDRIPVLINKMSMISWKMTLFVPDSKTLVSELERKINNLNVNIVPYCTTRIIGLKQFRNWAYRNNLGLPSSKNVLLPSILLMLNMGYKKIFLYGAEFSWTKTYSVNPENGNIYTDDVHFYDKTRIPLKKGAFKNCLACLVDALNATEYLQDYAECLGVKVINRTEGSFIDAFPYERCIKN